MSHIFNRRSVLGIAGGAGITLAGTGSALAKLAEIDIEPRGSDGILERLPTLDLESYDEMSTSTRLWIDTKLTKAAEKRALEIMAANGYGPDDTVPRDTAIAMLKDDPIISFRNHTWQRLQKHMWNALRNEFYSNYDAYMSEMESADKTGPGVLEFNPGIEPEYTKHEIHMQPGGYTGDEFAGHMYHYGTNNFYNGRNYQDEFHTSLTRMIPVPADGKVLRILDMGCGCGQEVVTLKKRFPEAEVWGVDVAAPMVRYAHMRAVDMGYDVNFRHALAEETGFPDGYFDIVTSYILHHEVPEQATYDIIHEAARVLRPGGIFYPIDFYTSPGRSAQDGRAWRRIRDWMTYRWNHERWLYEYQQADFEGEIRRSEMVLNRDEAKDTMTYPVGRTKSHNIMGTKPV
ncbi:MAG: class I SAM-dependent methyltransferase [Rhodospirillaceae bacterium]|jgi:ubiquinone/menaquinone biosynthesis C-methylase UbiE|nr:class I SAM-dependent methyltransferase [Rhodospirillaceae bacterium]MBT5565339.1 class I SAM-dependent methyltransferase [Rhodospirillaceae bacterium]